MLMVNRPKDGQSSTEVDNADLTITDIDGGYRVSIALDKVRSWRNSGKQLPVWARPATTPRRWY